MRRTDCVYWYTKHQHVVRLCQHVVSRLLLVISDDAVYEMLLPRAACKAGVGARGRVRVSGDGVRCDSERRLNQGGTY